MNNTSECVKIRQSKEVSSLSYAQNWKDLNEPIEIVDLASNESFISKPKKYGIIFQGSEFIQLGR